MQTSRRLTYQGSYQLTRFDCKICIIMYTWNVSQTCNNRIFIGKNIQRADLLFFFYYYFLLTANSLFTNNKLQAVRCIHQAQLYGGCTEFNPGLDSIVIFNVVLNIFIIFIELLFMFLIIFVMIFCLFVKKKFKHAYLM